MNYEIKTKLKRHVPKKESTEYAIFLVAGNKPLRLDFEILDRAGLEPEEVDSLMHSHIQNDVNDDELMARIPEGEWTDVRVQEWVKSGFSEY